MLDRLDSDSMPCRQRGILYLGSAGSSRKDRQGSLAAAAKLLGQRTAVTELRIGKVKLQPPECWPKPIRVTLPYIHCDPSCLNVPRLPTEPL